MNDFPDPYEVHPQNMLAPVRPNPMALAQRTPVGQMVLKPESQFLALAQAAGLNPASFVLELAAVATKKPEILRCSEDSVVAFLLDAAKLRLTIGRGIYPVPIKGKLEGWVGYKGAKELACRGGAIRDCWAAVRFEGDEFEMEEVPIPTVTRHRYGPHRGNMAKAVGVYATLLYPGGRTRHKYFSREKILAYRNRNPSHSKSDSPWKTAEEEMWLAKAILHTVSDLPHSSPELGHLRQMLEREEAAALPAPGREELPRGGPSTTVEAEVTIDEGVQSSAAEPPQAMPLEVALEYTVRGKNKQPQRLAELRNSALEAWLDWARKKLDADPDSEKLQGIANACARVLEARRSGEHQEPAKSEG